MAAHYVVEHYADRDGLWEPSSDTADFGDVSGLIAEGRAQVLSRIRRALDEAEPLASPDDGSSAVLAPLRRELDAAAQTLDDVEREIDADTFTRYGIRVSRPRSGSR
jgi:hypothetical protein